VELREVERNVEQVRALRPAGGRKFIPVPASRAEFVMTGTPYTLHARTANYDGAIMGWSYDRTKTLHRGSLRSIAKCVQTPLPNLFIAGHWAFSPGGSPVAIMTGKLAANHILETLGKK
jgi:phytoene dehydrogenase-like protein